MNSRLDKIIWESAFDKKKRNPGLTFNAELALARRSNNPSTYLPTPSRLLPSPCPPLGPPSDRCTDSRFPYPSRGLFPPSPRPKPSQMKAVLFSFFSFFMLIRRDSNPSPLCLPLCLPISCLFNAYANCAIPARLQIQWFFCMLFICKSNSCPSLAVENNDIMNLRPRGPWGPTGPRTKTNQS